MFDSYKSTNNFLNEVNILAQERKKSIVFNNESIEVKGDIFYVSQDGNDDNSGLSPNEAWKSLDKVNSVEYSQGDAVLFNRGDVFRGQLRLKNGVSYSAYGIGYKPCIYGSPENGADPSKWILEDKENNIWRFYKDLLDVGTIVFNDGEKCGYKLLPSFLNGNYIVRDSETNEIFDLHKELSKDLMFFSKCDTELENDVPKKFATGKLYLKCDNGNPGEIFDSIEFNTRKNVIEGAFAQNVLVDNLCVKYGGSHGIGAGRVKNFTVQNCEIGWIGGGILYYNKKNEAVRYGNGIEVYTDCNGYYVKNNYIYDCYDTGITHQQGTIGGDGTFENIVYSGNLIEKCIWSIEYYHGNSDPSTINRLMKDIVIENNILRFAGEGFGTQRLTGNCYAHIMAWWFHDNKAQNFIIKNNIFDRSEHCILQINAIDESSLPILKNNIYIQKNGGLFGRYGLLPTGQKYLDVQSEYNKEIINTICKIENCDENNIYFLE